MTRRDGAKLSHTIVQLGLFQYTKSADQPPGKTARPRVRTSWVRTSSGKSGTLRSRLSM